MSTSSFDERKLIAVAAFAAFLATFNETFLNVGFTPIMVDLGVDVSTVQWLATAYMLGAAIMVPISAFAYRSIPTRPLFCATVALLVLGSVIGALAPNFEVLLAGRIVQALGTGMLIPIGMNITLEAAPREKLGLYMGVMGSMTTLGPSLSIIAAGLLLSFFHWRVLLWVFGGLALLCLILGAALLENIAHLVKPRLDTTSVVLVSLGLVALLYGISTVLSGSGALAIMAIIVGMVLLAAFARRQGRLEQPLINLSPLKVPAFAIGVILNMIALIVMFAMNILIPTYMQSIMESSSLMASLALFPAIMLSCIVSPLAGRLYDNYGVGKLLLLGFGLVCVFSTALSFAISQWSVLLIAVLYVPVICGCALIIGPVQSFALSSLPPENNPHGVTVMSTGFQVAGCLGSSIFTGVYASVLAGSLSNGTAASEAGSLSFLAAGILAAVFALVGLLFAVKESTLEKKRANTGSATSQEQPDKFSLRTLMKRDVYRVREDDSVASVLRLLVDRQVSGVPVVNGEDWPVGFISDGDIMRYLADQHASFTSVYSFSLELENSQPDKKLAELIALPVSALGVGKVISVHIDDDLGEVCKVLADHHLKKVIVLEAGKMVGILNRSNITKYLVSGYLDARQA